MSEYNKPLPVTQPWSEEFWKGTKQHKFLIQHCHDCGQNIFYPRKFCPNCWSGNLGWIESKGKGNLFSYTTVLAGVEPVFSGDVPYVLALVDMDEGIRVMSRIVECKPDELKCDMEVEVVYADITDKLSLFYFRPAKQ
jgi:uncharacterized protein